MLNENNEPGQGDSWLAKEVTRAMHDYAGTINDAPPLRLSPRFSLSWPHVPRWQAWLVPVTVAAVVVSLAVSLVLVRSIRNGGGLTTRGTTGSASGGPVSTASSTAPSPAASVPAGVPQDYLAIQTTISRPAKGKPPLQTYSLVAGDTRTGKALGTVVAPTGDFFDSVAAAGDDRTFVAAEQIGTGGSAPIQFLKVRLDPGARQAVQVTTLPVKRQVFGTAKSLRGLGDQYNVALSSTGTELALIDFSNNSELAVNVFSVTTGKLLQRWTTTAIRSGLVSTMPTLTWIDDNKGLALATLGVPSKQGGTYKAWQTVRTLKVGGAGGDLVKDSTVVRHVQAGAEWGDTAACGYELQWPPVISANGGTFTCTTGGTFITYGLSAGPTAGFVYSGLKTSPNDFVSEVLWSNSTAGTLILEWGVEDNGYVNSGSKFVHVYVVGPDKAPVQLTFPKNFRTGLDANTIAW